MTEKKLKPPVLDGLLLLCPSCGKLFSVMASRLMWSANSQPCVICGSHGSISVTLLDIKKCPACGEKIDDEIELHSW